MLNEKEWFPISVTPPDGDLIVKDAEGNEAWANPTWYPFRVEHKPGERRGRFSGTVVPCEPYWDGGWMVSCEGLTCNVGDITHWRYPNEK